MIAFIAAAVITSGLLAHLIDRANFRIDELERRLITQTENLARLRRQLEIK